MSATDTPHDTWTQRRTYILFGVLVFAFVQAGLYAGRWHAADNFPDNTLLASQSPSPPVVHTRVRGHVDEHPIPKLMDEAERKFRKLLSKQSRSLKAAVAEYRRRYRRNPPKGFDEWWKFAQENNVRMVDEFDGLMDDMAPFWNMTGAEFRKRAVQAAQLPSIDLVRIRGGEAEATTIKNDFDDDDVSMRARSFLLMVSKFQHTLPDMDFPINARSEGRVLVPWELRAYPNTTFQDSLGGINSIVGSLYTPDWQGRGSVWEAYRRVCPPDSPARRLISSKRMSFTHDITNYFQLSSTPGNDFKFVRGVDGNFSFCNNPWAHYNQGHFFSDWRTVPLPYPILSPAKSSGYGDIKIPSHYYYGTTRRYTYAWDEVNLEMKTLDSMERPWEKKDDKIFWRGATTGGGSSPPGFSPQYQRHRFVRMASDASPRNTTVVFADPPSSSNYVYARVPTAALNAEIMDVAFVSSVDHVNYPGGLQQQMKDHRFGDAVLLRDYWAHKYLLDLDGMSYSGKFFAYLASDSAVIKSSVYSEFFSDWIQPWLHYIPLSSSYQELYNIHAFFSGATDATLEAANSTSLAVPHERRKTLDGDRRLRRIARAGKQWKKTIGRQVDMEAYVYRLCLEYARLWSDDREAMSYTR
ncbi:capsular associated protein [Dentipellis sp. KUC8613]|nr:capsular associated protein [Dentipellis sp. KUC8613]